MSEERLQQLQRARERADNPFEDIEPIRVADTEPAPPPTLEQNRIAAARVWLHAVARDSSDLWASFAAKAILRGVEEGHHVNPEAMAWLAKQCSRGDAIHRGWAQCVYRTLDERK